MQPPPLPEKIHPPFSQQLSSKDGGPVESPLLKIWLEAQLLPPLPLAEMDKEMHTMDKEINTRKI